MPDRTESPEHRRRACTGKVKHRTRKESLAVLLAMVARNDDPDLVHRLQTYQCRYCGYFHLGRRLKSDAETCRRRWQQSAERQRRRSLWDASVQPRSAFDLWYEQAIYRYEKVDPGAMAEAQYAAEAGRPR